MAKKSKIKPIIGIVIFLISLSLLLTFVGKLVLPFEHFNDRQQRMYYYFPKNTVDVLCTGNSTFRQGFSPNTLWHEHGIVAYTRPDSRQSPELTYFEVKETLNRHSPKVVIMGVARLFSEYDYVENEPLVRRSLDYTKLSIEKIKTAYALASHTDAMETISYIFPLLRYHSRWNDISMDDIQKSFDTSHDIWRGEYRVNELDVLEDRVFAETSTEVPEYSKEAIKWYEKTLELCNEKGIKVIIVSMPEITNTRGTHEGIQRFADRYGADYLDFTTDELVEATGLKYSEDFQGGHHLAITGSRKITHYLGQYLEDNYDLPQWECSEELTNMLNEDYEAYLVEYDKSVKKLQKQLEKHKNK